MSTPVTSSAPASTASDTSRASNSSRRIINATGASDSITVDPPSGPSRYNREISCVAIRGRALSR
jgi:hypothetical protein